MRGHFEGSLVKRLEMVDRTLARARIALNIPSFFSRSRKSTSTIERSRHLGNLGSSGMGWPFLIGVRVCSALYQISRLL